MTRPWRAWYADGTVYASASMEWTALPAEGMVGVVVYLDPVTTPHRQIVDGADWYWLEDGEIRSVMTHAEWGQFVPAPHVPCAPCLKKSGAMDDEAWATVQREMMAARTAP